MEGSSNQYLWKILIGHSALRDSVLIKQEVSLYGDKLLNGLSYYKRPSPDSLKKLESSGDVSKSWRRFVTEISRHLELDQLQSLELFQSFLSGVYRGSLSELNQKLSTDSEQQRLLSQVKHHYYSERLYILKCLKHLLGYWQDSEHRYRRVYEECINEINKDETALIKSVWKQYEDCVNSAMPDSVKGQQEEAAWLTQLLREQIELLEIVLLYYKDFKHMAPELLKTAALFQSMGFGRKQHSRMSLVPAAESLLSHIGHLCSLILVEGVCLEWVEQYQDDSQRLDAHPLFWSGHESSFKELDGMICKWGDMRHHGPLLLAWMAFKYITLPATDFEEIKLLGNIALRADVFGYLLEVVRSPFFEGLKPVASICKCVLHTLLSLCVSSFSEESLGNPADLVALATETLTHPRLRLEFWSKGLMTGIGLLLQSAELTFPIELSSVLGLLVPLSGDHLSAQNVFHHLTELPVYCERISLSQLYEWVEPTEKKAGLWVLTTHRKLYSHESRSLGRPGLTLPPGTCGQEISSNVISWSYQFSGWEVFVLETCKVLHCPGLGTDPTPHPQAERAAAIAKLVTQLVKNDWSLAPYLQPITSQYFSIIQACSSFPNPPIKLLTACLECVAAMATRDSALVWQQLGRTGFLPYLSSTIADFSVKSVSVAPGYYGQILNVWERPRGIYPVSMAMLDLLISMSLPGNNLATNEMLACVVFVMKEMFPGSHNWRYRHMTNREDISHKLLELCHNILKAQSKEQSHVCKFVSYFLLHLSGGQVLLSTLAMGVDVVNNLCSNQQGSQLVLQVESLKLAFQIIDLLLQTKQDQVPTPLEHSLATQSLKQRVDSPKQVHLVSVIASYIHHHDNPHVPAGATKLLTQLSQIAPMSVFACLGSETMAIRDAYTNRLKSYIEDTELKVAILDLVTECVASQPGMMELFLSVQPNTSNKNNSSGGKNGSAATKASTPELQYMLDTDSCLHAVLDLMKPDQQGLHTPPSLLQAAMALLRGLWVGRHDAALIALRSQKEFWRNLTKPLFEEFSLEVEEERDTKEMSSQLLVCSHVMHIVSMETYYIVRNHMDKELNDILKKFSSTGRFRFWTKCLQSPPMSISEDFSSSAHPPPPELTLAQYELAGAWSSLLLVAASNEHVFYLSSPAHQSKVLTDILEALESQLKRTTSVSDDVVAIATELSMLYMVLSRKWSCDSIRIGPEVISTFNDILQSSCMIEAHVSMAMMSFIYTSLIQLLRNSQDNMEPRFILGLIPNISDTLQKHHIYLNLDSNHRPDVISIYLLKEVVQCCSSELALRTLREHSVIAVLLRTMDEHIRLQTDTKFIEATLAFFLSLSKDKSGTEALLVNEIAPCLSISLADTLMITLSSDEKLLCLQWQKIWQLALKLATTLLDKGGHHFVSSAISFTGVYQERLAQALDVFQLMKDLVHLEETLSVCQFLYQLSRYKQQWTFSQPALHSYLVERLIYLTSSCTHVLSNRANLKHIIKTMHASGALPQEYGPSAPVVRGRGRVRTLSGGKNDLPDAWVTSSPAFPQLQDGLLSILTCCLATLRHYTPSLDSIILEGVLDLSEYPPLFSLSMTPPTLDYTTPPSLATLTTCLTAIMNIMNKLEPHRAGTPSKSPGSSAKSPGHSRNLAMSSKKKSECLFLLEQAVFLILSQGALYLVSPTIETQDKQMIKKYLANSLDHFTSDLLRNFTRKGIPSPRSVTPTSRGHTHFQDNTSSKTSSLSFTDSAEQALFKVADSFVKQFFR